MERSRLFCPDLYFVVFNAVLFLEVLKPAIVGEGYHVLEKYRGLFLLVSKPFEEEC